MSEDLNGHNSFYTSYNLGQYLLKTKLTIVEHILMLMNTLSQSIFFQDNIQGCGFVNYNLMAKTNHTSIVNFVWVETDWNR